MPIRKCVITGLLILCLLSLYVPVTAVGLPVDSAVVENGTLTITGVLPENAARNVTLEVLASGKVWNDLENFTQGQNISDYLAYYGQLDGYAGKPYTITVRNFTGPSEPEVRLLLNPGNMFVYSPALLASINNAQTSVALETAFDNDYLVAVTAEEYGALETSEESLFWETFLAFRNSLTNSKFTSLSEAINNVAGCVRLTKLKGATNRNDIDAVLKMCAAFGLENNNSYDLYTNKGAFVPIEGTNVMSDTQRDAMATAILQKLNSANCWKSIESFTSDFCDNVILYAVKGSESKVLANTILNEASLLKDKLGDFTTLSLTEQKEVAGTLSESDLFTTIDALCQKVKELSKKDAPDLGDDTTQNGNDPGGDVGGSLGSVGGGGGGGGNKDTAKDENKEDNREEEITPVAPKNTFTDLVLTPWAEEAVYALRNMGIVSGKSETSFDPTSTVKREEFTKMLVLALDISGAELSDSFSDVDKDAWYYTYVASAVNTGLINGIGDGKFGVGGVISRQDMAVLIARALNYDETTLDSSFSDYEEISDYAKAAVTFVEKQGIMNGVGDNKFAPKMEVSRAQAAKVIFELTKRR